MRVSVLDLFCGAGGFSLGCERAGCDVLAGVDNDDRALETYSVNFDHPAYEYDLSETDPATFASETGIQRGDVDMIVGGPPCQGFSEANLERTKGDERNELVFRYQEYVEYYQPCWFAMENVPGITSIDDGVLLNQLCENFERAGYNVAYDVCDAAQYGVAQHRERTFVIGTRSDAGEVPQFPTPTHGSGEMGRKEMLSVVDVLDDLPALQAGECGDSNAHNARNHRQSTVESYRNTEPGNVPHSGYSPRVLHPEQPSWTITASDGKTPIHYEQPRMLSPREIARLQSFPDSFEIPLESRADKCFVIANAVPVDLAECVVSALCESV